MDKPELPRAIADVLYVLLHNERSGQPRPNAVRAHRALVAGLLGELMITRHILVGPDDKLVLGREQVLVGYRHEPGPYGEERVPVYEARLPRLPPEPLRKSFLTRLELSIATNKYGLAQYIQGFSSTIPMEIGARLKRGGWMESREFGFWRWKKTRYIPAEDLSLFTTSVAVQVISDLLSADPSVAAVLITALIDAVGILDEVVGDRTREASARGVLFTQVPRLPNSLQRLIEITHTEVQRTTLTS